MAERNRIFDVCETILDLTDEEITELRDIAEGQKHYLNPLRMATSHWQHELGEFNEKVLNAIIDLKALLETGADIKDPREKKRERKNNPHNREQHKRQSPQRPCKRPIPPVQ